jgi:hypothetical protein
MATKEALNEVQEIIDKIKGGEYLHDQSQYHSVGECGTAHCIAGWKVMRDAESIGLSLPLPPSFETADDKALIAFDQAMMKLTEDFGISSTLTWEYAQERWGLTHQEARSLFLGCLTLTQIQSALDKLKEKYGN